jgi:hypothetical protein
MEDLDRTLTYPSATLFIDSNPAPSQSGVFDRSRSLQIRATPGRPDHDNEVRVDGGYWFRASDATRSWDVQQTILGYLTPTTYTPDAGTENFDFTLPALFADELDHLSFFACVLKETDLLLAQTPPTPLQVSLGSYPGGGGPLPVGEDEGLGVENQGLGVAGLQWDFVNWTILQTPVVKKAGVSMLIGAVVIFISTPAVISWTTLAAANAAIDVGLPAVALRTLGFFANARWIPGLVSGVLRVAGIGVNVIATAKPGDFDAPPPKQPPQKPALPSAGAGGVPGMPPEMTPPPTFPDLGTSIDVPGEGMGVPPDE